MISVLITHEVDDVAHWLASPVRKEVFGSLGMTVRTFVDPAKTHRVGLLVETPDMASLEKMLASPQAAEAMKTDGVRPSTIVMLVQS
jgi:hypothetical protein